MDRHSGRILHVLLVLGALSACGPSGGACHNDVLDQSITRARFNIALPRMSREELDLAIERIQRAPGTPGVMPPPEARNLTDEARQALVEYFRQEQRSAADDALLERAARLGMAGNGPTAPLAGP